MMTLTKETANELVAIARKYQWANYKKASTQILTSFLPYIAIWIAMYFLKDVALWATLLLALPAAFFLVRIFIIQHDCGHQSFFWKRKYNDILWKISSYFTFMPYSYWAKSHSYHHQHSGMLFENRDIGDINTLTVEEYSKLSLWWKIWYRVFRNPIFMFGILPLRYIIIQIRLPLIFLKGWKKAKVSLLVHNIILTVFYFAIWFLLWWDVLLKIQLPIIIVFGTVAIWFFYLQHQHEFGYKQYKEKREYIAAAIQWSSYYKLPRLWHWLTGNIWYHHIHHLNAFVPSYAIAHCHRDNPVFEKYIQTLTFVSSLSCLWNHLRDEWQQRMVSFAYYRKHYRRNNIHSH